MSQQDAIITALAAALPTELAGHAGDLAALLSRDPAAIATEIAARPVLAVALASLAGQTIAVAGAPLQFARHQIGTLQEITISGGYVHQIIGTAISIQLPPVGTYRDLASALELLAAMPLDDPPPHAPLPTPHRMPFSRNPHFVGRGDDLRWLAATLKGGATAAIGQIAAATGLGGVGKTNLATEFAHRYGQFFAGGVFWLSFADPQVITAEIAACGMALNLPGFADLKIDDQVRRVMAAWQEALPRLLIFDNCEDEALLAQWRPTTGGCRVLVTSRRAIWSRSLAVASHPLGILSREESIALLHKHRPDLAADDPWLAAIAEELGDLPLALHLAGSFLETYRQSPTFGNPANFFAELRDQRLLDHDALQGIDVTPSPTNHELHVARTFALSTNQLSPSDPVDALARRILARAACLAPGETIPRDLLFATLELAEDDRAALRQAERGLRRVVDVGLVDIDADGAISLHRLVTMFIERSIVDNQKQNAVIRGIEKFTISYIDDYLDIIIIQKIIVHLEFLTQQFINQPTDQTIAIMLLTGRVLTVLGDYPRARDTFEMVLRESKRLQEDNPDFIATVLHYTGALAFRQNDLNYAYRCQIEAFNIRKHIWGEQSLEVAASLFEMGAITYLQGNLDEAWRLQKQVLKIRKRELGKHHIHIAASYHQLGAISYSRRNFSQAHRFHTAALMIRQNTFGNVHPDVAASLFELGTIALEMLDLTNAQKQLEKSLEIREKIYGSLHLETAGSLNNLAINYCYQGKFEQAADLMRRALSIREQRLGLQHPYTQDSRRSLAAIEQRLAQKST
ncbi:TPR repeat-containing protein [Oscillochloris trichoides DG-6]|uniref:TPR repeat-containing protein n=1 Tax=Oscillochloris trichoides DG-6 TaxID=765420 RepID=E1IF49_9CHLR|nr:tetratricopeptide repeat protein [Oscillochloris trichoides]EFO80190.1 TPR repeat-containing protein [Oscillochloris trichoides DG-6]